MASDIKKALGVLNSRKGPPLSKADLARSLFSQGFKVNDVSHAVPMAYSQALSVFKKMYDVQPKSAKAKDPLATPQVREQTAKGSSSWGQSVRAAGRRTTKPMKSPVLDAIKRGKPVDIGQLTGRVGKLRTPGLPSDTDVGPCANCEFDLVIRQDKQGYFLMHVGVSAEEYMQTVQFCRATPQVLIA